MLNRDEIAVLHRQVQNEKVLSVYLDGATKGFSERGAWRTRMEHAIAEIRKTLSSASADERAEFEAAAGHVLGALSSFDFLPGRGWVGFAARDRLVMGSVTRVPMPDLVRWESGACLAPYVRALKQDRLVVGILVDSRRGRVFEYRDGLLEETTDLLADTFLGDLTDAQVSIRANSFTGVRGESGADTRNRLLDVEAERLLKRLAELAVTRVGTGGILVVGGVPESVRAMTAHLPHSLLERTIERPSATLELSAPEAIAVIEEAASELNRRMQERLLQEVVDQARSGRKGELGREAVEKALSEGRVDTLLLSRALILKDPDLADRLVAVAFAFHGEVEELSGEGARRLDAEGDGVAARLRYVA